MVNKVTEEDFNFAIDFTRIKRGSFAFHAAYDRFVNGFRPSEIAAKYGKSRPAVTQACRRVGESLSKLQDRQACLSVCSSSILVNAYIEPWAKRREREAGVVYERPDSESTTAYMGYVIFTDGIHALQRVVINGGSVNVLHMLMNFPDTDNLQNYDHDECAFTFDYATRKISVEPRKFLGKTVDLENAGNILLHEFDEPPMS